MSELKQIEVTPGLLLFILITYNTSLCLSPEYKDWAKATI